MEFSKETLNRLLELNETKVLVVDGRSYSTRNVTAIEPPEVEALQVHTLTGIVNYINITDVIDVVIVVESPTCVKVVAMAVDALWKTRAVHVVAECYGFDFVFGRFYPQDEFVIKLRTWFADSQQRADTIKQAGHVSDEHATVLQDDGVSQQVTVKKGVRFENQVLVNPVLSPIRSFPEIDPVPSEFVVRYKEGSFALFDSEGDRWKQTTIMAIVEYLKMKVPAVTVIF